MVEVPKGLIERAGAMAALELALSDARSGKGRVVVITGEAGIGKSTLVRAFVRGQQGARVLLGACDDLVTPRALGPIYDLSLQAGSRLREALEEPSNRERVLLTLFSELARPPVPVVVVIEDAHWADEATVDVLTVLARRIEMLPALLVMTVRDTDVEEGSRLGMLLGSLRAPICVRIPLALLSIDGVRAIASASGAHGDEVYRETGGNPFFVTELLAAREEGVPASVSQAILSRIEPLSDESRELLELMSIVPARVESWLLDRCQPGWTDAIEPAERRGMVRLEGGTARFRHELARRAIEAALPMSRRVQLHRRVLAALKDERADPARIVHHAEQAADVETLVEVAPAAARRAGAASAHREALAHYQRAVRYADRLEPAERAQLFEEYSVECFTNALPEECSTAAARALELRRSLGESEELGRALRWASRVAWWRGNGAEASNRAAEAIAVLEKLPKGVELARAYNHAAQLAMISQRDADVERWGGEAIELARELGAEDVLGQALCNVGMSRRRLGTDDGSMVEQGIDLVREHGLHDEASRMYMNLAFSAAAFRRYLEAEQWLDEGEAYATEHEMTAYLRYMEGTRILLLFDQGQWDAALERAAPLLSEGTRPITSFMGLYATARILTRRGEPTAGELVRQVWEIAEGTGELQRIGPAAAAVAELAWFEDRLAEAEPHLRRALQLATQGRVGRVIGDTALWLHRAGLLDALPEGAEEPYALQIRGEPLEAARRWRELGCPYEEATALAESEDPDALSQALRIFDDLGAVVPAARLRARMRAMGVSSVPRGPQAATRGNPAGLTTRQVDVLRLLVQGLTNAEIAEELVLSTRTVDHHVAAILAKLEARNRRDAARRAAALGLLSND